MPLAETARLIASLELGKNTLASGADKAAASVGRLEGRLGRIGGIASKGAQTAARNVAAIGAVAAVAIGTQVRSGLQSLAELESATTSVDGAIQQLGLTGQLTGKQIAGWANEIEAAVGAAFDDKEITQAATTLLRFGKVTPQNLRPALTVMTDLATKTGSVDSAASLLAKALADPEKAAGKLARTGIVLTKQQQAQIKAMVKAGKVADAQAFILRELERSTKGAALASQGPYQRSLATLADVTEDAQRALAEGFLPVIEKVRKLLSEQLAKPETIRQIREFGKGLAAGLDDLIEVGKRVPWAQIGESLKLAGTGARAVLQAFTSLPPWVQTAVLTGWGLNKLTGGALGGIVGELGKGLIKGVLGINAGVVNIKAGTVTGAGGGIAAAGKGGGVRGVLGSPGAAIAALTVGAIAVELMQVRNSQSEENRATAVGVVDRTRGFAGSADIADVKRRLAEISAYDRKLSSELTPEAIAYQLNIDGVRETVKTQIGILAQRTSTNLLAATAAIQSVERAEARTAATVAAKNFDPTINVAPPRVDVRISATAITRVTNVTRRYTRSPSRFTGLRPQ